MMTVTNERRSSTSPTISSILNKSSHLAVIDTPIKEYLPTPVTPASDFNQFNSKKNGAYSTFSVIKPPIGSPPLAPTTLTTSNQIASQQQQQQQVPQQQQTQQTKPYPCPECHQTFSRPHNLKSHLTTHSSERPFQCDVCNHHFRRHHDLKRHQKLHTGERPYVCKDCYRSFARLDALNRHRRAEGGTACSTVHQQQQQQQIKQEDATTTTDTPTPTKSPPQRPIIPQLHIPHPASHLYPKEKKIGASPSIPPPDNNKLLPSPSALSTLPIANNNNLTPIYHSSGAAATKSLPTTPSSPLPPPSQKHHSKSPLYHPYPQPWSPYTNNNSQQRPTLPPLSSPPPAAGASAAAVSAQGKQHNVDRLLQENDELKRDINQLRAMAQKEASSLKSRIHDLEVENKVLRSLIHNPTQQQQDHPLSRSNSNDSHHD